MIRDGVSYFCASHRRAACCKRIILWSVLKHAEIFRRYRWCWNSLKTQRKKFWPSGGDSVNTVVKEPIPSPLSNYPCAWWSGLPFSWWLYVVNGKQDGFLYRGSSGKVHTLLIYFNRYYLYRLEGYSRSRYYRQVVYRLLQWRNSDLFLFMLASGLLR